MSIQFSLDGDLSRDILKEFAKFIVPFIREFTDSADGKQYVTAWVDKHPEFENEENYIYDDDDGDDEI